MSLEKYLMKSGKSKFSGAADKGGKKDQGAADKLAGSQSSTIKKGGEGDDLSKSFKNVKKRPYMDVPGVC